MLHCCLENRRQCFFVIMTRGAMKTGDQQLNSFVVRIWREAAGETGRPAWRGWIQHTRSREAVYVQDLEGLLDFIQRWTGALAGPQPPASHLK